jgi:lipid-binding SYLF domain-containing protein
MRFFLSMVLATASLASTSLLNTASGHRRRPEHRLSTSIADALQDQSLIRDLSHKAKAVLVFPKIIKAGLVFGGSYGEGVLMKGTKVEDYYNSVSGSGAGGRPTYGCVVFLMNDKALKYITETKGLEIGVGPTVVVVDEGVAKNLSSSTLKDDAYAFIFDQQGLMADQYRRDEDIPDQAPDPAPRDAGLCAAPPGCVQPWGATHQVDAINCAPLNP